MSRFSIGSEVKIVGAVAENYKCLTALVIHVYPNAQGLSHLNKYQVQVSDRVQDTFYEFQLSPAQGSEHSQSA